MAQNPYGSESMPQPTEHIAQAEKNERLYESLVGTEFNDWAITALFYAALHYVDAYFVSQTGVRPPNHNLRNRLVDRTLHRARVSPAYRELYRLSRKVRYETPSVSTDEAMQVNARLFDPIRAHIRALLGIS